MQLAIGI